MDVSRSSQAIDDLRALINSLEHGDTDLRWQAVTRSGQLRNLAERLIDADPADVGLELEVLRGFGGEGKRRAALIEQQIDVRRNTRRRASLAVDDLEAASKAAKRKRSIEREAKVWSMLAKPAGGQPRALATGLNTRYVLEHDSRWTGMFRRNLLNDDPEILDIAEQEWRPIRDTDETGAGYWIDEVYGFSVGRRLIGEAMRYLADRRQEHPVAMWLESRKWDGVPRINGLLGHYLGAKARPDVPGFDDLLAVVSRRWMIAAVARALKYPCKVDTVLVLQGAEGERKSSALAALVPHRRWFSDTTLPDLRNTVEVYTQIKGTWIYEIQEIERWTRRKDVEEVTAFLTQQEEKYRPKYDRSADFQPRMCLFVGTTNKAAFLNQDRNRRYWPFAVQGCRVEDIERDRDQLWAEAVAAFKAGEPWHLSREQEAVMVASMADYQDEHPWTSAVLRWRKSLPENERTEPFATADALRGIGLPAVAMTPANDQTVSQILRDLGFEAVRPRVGSKRPRMWSLPSGTTGTTGGTTGRSTDR